MSFTGHSQIVKATIIAYYSPFESLCVKLFSSDKGEGRFLVNKGFYGDDVFATTWSQC